MRIIKDERTIEAVDLCENCNKEKKGRRVKAYGLHKESRGYYFLCFDCFQPRVFWRPRGKYSKVISTPIRKDKK